MGTKFVNVSTIIHDSLFILIKPLSNPLNFVNRAMKEMFHLTMPAACPRRYNKGTGSFYCRGQGFRVFHRFVTYPYVCIQGTVLAGFTVFLR